MSRVLTEALEAMEADDERRNASALKGEQMAEDRRRKEAKAVRDKAQKRRQEAEHEGECVICPLHSQVDKAKERITT